MAWTDPRTWVTGEVVTASLMNTHVRDNLNMTAPHIVTTAGDIVYATGDSALQRLALGTAGYILHVGGSSAPAWTNSPSIAGIALTGVLDANGSIDFDGTTAAFDGSGAITLTSTSTSANGIYLRANGGTGETIKIHSDLGTSVTEGAASVSMLSDAGGVELRSTANLANAINLTVDGGTTSSMTLFNDQGTSVTEGSASIQLLSDAGGIGIKSTANLANAILITADGGTSETIVLHADQGSGADSIKLLSDAGGITLTANGNVTVTNNMVVSGNLTVSGSSTTVDTATLSVEDPLIILASGNNAADALDIGFYGLYDTSGSTDLYAGLFRDANDSGKFKLFKDLQAAPTTTVNVSGTGYAVATLVANIEAGTVDIDGGAVDGAVIGANSAAAITGTTITANTAIVPDASGGADIGTTSLEWGDVYIADDKKIYLGSGQDVSLEYDEDGTDELRISGNTVFVNSVDHTLDAHFDSTPADETVSGITATFTAGEDLSRGEVVYYKPGDSKMWKAVATAIATSRCVAMAAEDVSADATAKFLLKGFLQDNGTFPSYTAGDVLYTPEAATSGENVPEAAAPDTDGDFVQIIGWAVDANTVYFNPDSTVIEVA